MVLLQWFTGPFSGINRGPLLRCKRFGPSYPERGRDGHNPLSCKYGALSAVRAEGYTQFLGSIRPADRVERTRTNMSVGHAMKPMSEAHFAILRRALPRLKCSRKLRSCLI